MIHHVFTLHEADLAFIKDRGSFVCIKNRFGNTDQRKLSVQQRDDLIVKVVMANPNARVYGVKRSSDL